MSTVLVTGGAGFIGSALIRLLVRETRHTVVNVDKLTYAANLESLAEVEGNPRYHFARADVCDAAQLGEIFERHRPDAVIHLAAESHVDRSIDAPADFMRTNVLGTFTLLQECRRHYATLRDSARDRFRFIHVSTDEVFGALGPHGCFDEATAYAPSSPYAASKAASDHVARAWHRTYGLPVVVTNCSNNFGPYQFPEKLIPLTVRHALAGRAVPVYGKGENVRDWIFVDDHARALLRALEAGRPGDTYLVGARAERRNLDVVRSICALLDEIVPNPDIPDRAALIEFVHDRPGHDFRYAIDPSKVERELRWAPRESFESGLRRTVAWYVDHIDWCDRVAATEAVLGERIGRGLSI